MRRTLLLATCSVLAAGACGRDGVKSPSPATVERAGDPADAPARQAYDAAIEALTSAYFDELPEVATYYGAPLSAAPDAAGRLNQRGGAAETARRIRMESILSGLQAVDAGALDPLRRTTINSLVFTLDSALAPGRVVEYGAVLSEYGVWYLPYLINHNSGPLIAIPSLLEAQHTIKSAANADTYVKSLQAIAPTLDGALEKMRADVAAGVMPPDFIIDKTIAVIDAFTGSAPEDNVLYESFRAKLERATIDTPDHWLTPARAVVADQVFPAYRRIGDYLREIRPGTVHDAGI
jgi:uncharacterized protein (DUF885 family)